MHPNGWRLGTIEDIAKVTSGGTPSRNNDSYWNGQIPWVTTSEVKFGVITDTEQKITQEGLANSSAKLFPKDTILIAMYGQGKTRGQVAKLGIEASTNQACAALLLAKDYDVDYYYQYLTSQYENIRDLSNSGGQQNLSAGIIKEIHVPIPPLPEQRKIAKILSTWDKAIATTERLIATSQQQKKALMQQLLTGRKRLVNPDTGMVFEGDWKFASFNEIFKVANNKSTQIPASNYLESGRIPIVDQGKMLIGGFTNSQEIYRDLPVIIFGDHTRIIKWVNFEFAPGADGTQVLKSHSHVDAKFSYYLLLHTDIPNLGYSRHMRELKEKDFKYPSDIFEQKKIASVLTAADKEVELLEAKLAHLKKEKKSLMQQLLTGKRRVKVDAKEVA